MVDSVLLTKNSWGRIGKWSVITALAAIVLSGGYAVQGAADPSGGAVLQPVRIDPAITVKKEPVPNDLVVAGSPALQMGEHVFYTSPQGTTRVGVQDVSGPGKIHLNMTIDEYVHVVDGQATLRDASGNSWVLKKGDTVLVPKGFKGEASVEKHFRSEFVQVSSAPRQE